MGLGTHVEYPSRTNKLKNNEKEESMRVIIEGSHRHLKTIKVNQISTSSFNKRIEPELTIDRGGNRDGTRGFGINMAKHEHRFLNPEIKNHLSNAGKRNH
jgi:hypothetical protein